MAMNYERANRQQRTKQALIRSAAADLPHTIVAHFNGHCPYCKRGWLAGTKIKQSNRGWTHAHCNYNDDDPATRLQTRRTQTTTHPPTS